MMHLVTEGSTEPFSKEWLAWIEGGYVYLSG
uniref:Uncharacterized protein n=1 Tax=Musa acuminata subsp. malaccensis TaxID=214687 RepID=A0A804ILN4_MUSAM